MTLYMSLRSLGGAVDTSEPTQILKTMCVSKWVNGSKRDDVQDVSSE